MSVRSTLSQLVRRGALSLLVIGTFLTVLGGRWAFIEMYGTDHIEWDQWDAEGTHALRPWLEGGSFWRELLVPHNEHRVILTKVINVFVTELNGQWDQRLETVLNAVLPAALAVFVLIWTLRRCSARWSMPMFLVLVVGLASPVAWQNILGGFHSQQFLLILTALVALATLPFAPTGSKRWWAGAIAVVLGLGTMGSGFIAGAGVVGLVALRSLWHRTPWRPYLPAVCLSGAVVLVGLLTRVEVPYHENLKAQTLGQILDSLRYSLTWPSPQAASWAIVLWLPWVLLFGWWAREKDPTAANSHLFVLGLGGWVLVQLVATAVMRGGGGAAPASRYIDTLVAGSIANGMALVSIASTLPAGWRKATGVLVALAWMTFFTHGAAVRIQEIMTRELAFIPQYRTECTLTTRGYLYSLDARNLQRGDVPYPGKEAYADRLQPASLRPLMPPSVRKPDVEWVSAQEGPFRTLTLDRPAELNSPSLDREGRAGLPALVPDWGAEPTWSSFGVETPGTFVSVPQYLEGRSFRIDAVGTWDTPGVRLEIRHATTGEVVQQLRPMEAKEGRWQPIFFAAPSFPFTLAAVDESATGWLAWTGLREETLGSRWARFATEVGLQVLWVGLGMGASTALVLLVWPSPTLSRRTSSS